MPQILLPVATRHYACKHIWLAIIKYWISQLAALVQVNFSRQYLVQSRLCYSVASVCAECTVAKRCILEQKVTIDSPQKVVYKKLIGTKINDLDLCLEVVSRSCQSLCYIWRWISRKLLETEAWFQRTTNRKWHTGYQSNGHVTVWRHMTPKGTVKQYGQLS